MRALPLLAALCAAPAIVAAPSAARATTVVPITAEALAHRADAVVVATARAYRSQWSGGFIVTDVDVEVQSSVRGALAPGARFVLQLPGGTVGRISQRIEGVPFPAVGTPCVFFLSLAPDGSGAYRLAHFTAGVMPLAVAADGAVTARPAADGMIVQSTAGAVSPTTVVVRAGLPLASLAAALRGAR